MKTNSVRTLSAAVLGLMMQATFAGNITAIDVSVLPNQQRLVRLKFDQTPVVPKGSITSAPAPTSGRIFLDFPTTGIQIPQSTLSYNDTLLKHIATAQANGNSRLMFVLSKESQYDTQIKGDEVHIYISESTSVNTAPEYVQVGVSNGNTVTRDVGSNGVNIDFRKGQGNEGIVEFVSEYRGEPEVKVYNDRLVLTLKNYPILVQDQRNFDVADFVTPVRTVSVKRLGNDTQITINANGSWEHKLSQSNGRRIVSIKQKDNITSKGMTADSAKSKKFTGKKVTLDFQDISVRTVLQILAKESNMNIIASDNVQGNITLSLKDVPWDQALDLVLDLNNLDMKKVGNVLHIAPRTDMLQRQIENAENQRRLDEMGILIERSFQLKYKNVEVFRKILNLSENGTSTGNHTNSILTSRGSALIDPGTNTLIINDTPSVVAKFERLIEELDVPVRQVMVEARIVVATDGVSRELGMKFGLAGKAQSNGHGKIQVGSQWVTGSNSTSFDTPNINLPLSSLATGALAIVSNIKSSSLGLELSAMEEEERTKTISIPRVLTQDRKEAEIKQGKQIPYRVMDGDGNTTVSFKDAVLSLKVTPHITPNNKIIMDINILNDEEAGTTSTGEIIIGTQSVKTQAMVDDGATLILGGVYVEKHTQFFGKVPFLGDIPLIGNLFKSRRRGNERNELLFFITPRIMGEEGSVLRY